MRFDGLRTSNVFSVNEGQIMLSMNKNRQHVFGELGTNHAISGQE